MAKQARIVDFEEARTASRRSRGTQSRSAQARSNQQHRNATGQGTRSGRSSGRNANVRAAEGRSSSQTQSNRRKTSTSALSESLKKRQHDARKRKADRAFDRMMPTSTPSNEGGTRAAVYRTQMGSSHRRSSRMRTEQEAADRGVRAPRGGVIPAISIPSKLRIPLIILACVLACAVFLYPPARDYYVAVRTEAKHQVELEVYSAQNEALQDEVAQLSTDEGIEDQAASEYGWAKEDEHAVVVEGVTRSGNNDAATSTTYVTSPEIKAPETWYSPFLDPFFGYKG